MSELQIAVGQRAFMERGEIHALIRILREEGYTVLAPVLDRGVVSLRPVEAATEIAAGVSDEQQPGSYRATRGDRPEMFGYAVGPDSAKRYLFPPHLRLFALRVNGADFQYQAAPPHPPRLAIVGIRPCDIAAIETQDRVFMPGTRCEQDAYYMQARRQMLLIAVNCTHPSGTCFCASMGTGPEARPGSYDLALTELRSGFIVTVGSARGAELARKLKLRKGEAAELELAELRLERAGERMGRVLETAGLKELLDRAIEHPRWQYTAQRCLGCGNCTMVCPTCFCSSVVDSSDLTGEVSRERLWDCCHTHQFTYTTAGPVRASIAARYRHWMRHKLGTWHDQFGTSGCVGCGRCLTWCPVGIDITEEAAAIRGDWTLTREAKP